VVIVNNSLLTRNSAVQYGGGVDNFNGTVRITNSTLSGNSAADCGGLNDDGGFASLSSSTLSSNAGGRLCGFERANVEVVNSLIVNSVSGPNCSGDSPFNTAGNNLSTDVGCLSLATGGGTFRQVSAARLKLGPLGAYGGPIQSHALLLGSVAIDAGSRAECSSCGVVFDKHNFKRPIDGNKDRVAVCDIGAFEFGSPSITCAGEVVTLFGG
jgi:hypothetical protein